MEKYVEQITEHLVGTVNYLDDPNTVQTDEQYDRALDEVKDLDEIVRSNKELDNKHDEEIKRIRSQMWSNITGHIGGTITKVVAIGMCGLALFQDKDSVFSKQLSNLGNAISKLL